MWAIYCHSWDGTYLEETFVEKFFADTRAEELNKMEAEKMDDFSDEWYEYYVEEI